MKKTHWYSRLEDFFYFLSLKQNYISWKMSLFVTCVLEFWSHITKDITSKTLGYKNSYRKNPIRLFLFVFWNVCPYGLLKSYFQVLSISIKTDWLIEKTNTKLISETLTYPQKRRRWCWKSNVIEWEHFKRHVLLEADLGCSVFGFEVSHSQQNTIITCKISKKR